MPKIVLAWEADDVDAETGAFIGQFVEQAGWPRDPAETARGHVEFQRVDMAGVIVLVLRPGANLLPQMAENERPLIDGGAIAE